MDLASRQTAIEIAGVEMDAYAYKTLSERL